jgi:hypothetical protein
MGDSARYRDKAGEIGRKYGDILIGILRKTYGASFAKDCGNDELGAWVRARLQSAPWLHFAKHQVMVCAGSCD